MNVKQLIEELQKLPSEKDVLIVYDGAARMDVCCTWISRDGNVLLAGNDEPVYHDSDRPIDAPNEIENKNWRTPK